MALGASSMAQLLNTLPLLLTLIEFERLADFNYILLGSYHEEW